MTDPTITIAGLRATIEREYYREQARTMAGEIVELQAERRGHAAERQSLTAERDALAAQLAEVRAELDRLRATDLTRDAAESTAADQLAILRADLASERAHLAACRTRIAGLEQAADERSGEVARLTAERTEWIAAAVAIGERVDHLGPVASGGGDIAPREWIHYAQDLAGRVKARIAGDGRPCNGSCDIALASRQVGPDGIVPRNARECAELWEREAARLWREETRLTARVAELEARPVMTEESLSKALGWTRHIPKSVSDETASDVLRHLGPVTLPAQDRAEELARLIAVEPIRTGEWKALVERTRAALASLGAPATTPTAAPDRSLALTAASLLRDIVRNEGLAQGGEIGPRSFDCLDMVRRLESTPTAAPGES